MYTDNDYRLYHHGILGQKWGVRRFQNADGTLTAEGKKRYTSPNSADQKKDISRIADQNRINESNRIAQEMSEQSQREMERQVIELQNQQINQIHQTQQQLIEIDRITQEASMLSIQEAQRAASTSMTFGMNPFMFG